MNSPTIGPATVKTSGGLEVSGNELRNAKLTFIGGSPNATVKLYRWEDTGVRGGRFHEYDCLRKATVVEDDNNPDKITITGISQATMEAGQGSFQEADALTTWNVMVTGRCGDCG